MAPCLSRWLRPCPLAWFIYAPTGIFSPQNSWSSYLWELRYPVMSIPLTALEYRVRVKKVAPFRNWPGNDLNDSRGWGRGWKDDSYKIAWLHILPFSLNLDHSHRGPYWSFLTSSNFVLHFRKMSNNRESFDCFDFWFACILIVVIWFVLDLLASLACMPAGQWHVNFALPMQYLTSIGFTNYESNGFVQQLCMLRLGALSLVIRRLDPTPSRGRGWYDLLTSGDPFHAAFFLLFCPPM